MADHGEIIAFLRRELRAIKPKLPRDWPTEAKYRADLHLDSLDLVELVARVEQRFGMLIVDEELSALTSLDATASFIRAKAQ